MHRLLHAPRIARRTPTALRGIGLIELLVGLAVGGIVLAASMSVFARQLAASRAETQILRQTQDVRAATALIGRAVRHAAVGSDGSPALQVAADGTSLVVRRAVAAGTEPEEVAFRLSGGAIEHRLGDGRWQAVTDGDSARVTRLVFRIDPPAGGCGSVVWMPMLRWEADTAPVGQPGRVASWSGSVQVRQPLPIPECTP
jgi:type II secretory pathway component PulJ